MDDIGIGCSLPGNALAKLRRRQRFWEWLFRKRHPTVDRRAVEEWDNRDNALFMDGPTTRQALTALNDAIAIEELIEESKNVKEE